MRNFSHLSVFICAFIPCGQLCLFFCFYFFCSFVRFFLRFSSCHFFSSFVCCRFFGSLCNICRLCFGLCLCRFFCGLFRTFFLPLPLGSTIDCIPSIFFLFLCRTRCTTEFTECSILLNFFTAGWADSSGSDLQLVDICT